MKTMSQELTVTKSGSKKIIALAVICVVLAASLVGVIAYYADVQSQNNQKDEKIAGLTEQVAALQLQVSQSASASTYIAQISSLNSQISALNDTLALAYAEYAALQKIVNLAASGVLYSGSLSQDANATTMLWQGDVQYAGYIVVTAQADANTTYAQITYSFEEFNFNFNQTIGTSGTALFPILPSTVTVYIGNINQFNANSVNATATYHY